MTLTPIEENTIPKHLTLLLNISAAGHHSKPLLIMGTKFVPNLTNDVLDNFCITYQESGWMNQEILPQYVDKVFLKELEEIRGNELKDEVALLIVDGHNSRDALDLPQLWNDHKLLVLIIRPPPSSQFCQPFHKKVNIVFKEVVKKISAY